MGSTRLAETLSVFQCDIFIASGNDCVAGFLKIMYRSIIEKQISLISIWRWLIPIKQILFLN